MQKNQSIPVVPTRDGTPALVNGGLVLHIHSVPQRGASTAGLSAAVDIWRVETAKGILELHRILGRSGERDRWLLAGMDP
jgi:hypothetical protein